MTSEVDIQKKFVAALEESFDEACRKRPSSEDCEKIGRAVYNAVARADEGYATVTYGDHLSSLVVSNLSGSKRERIPLSKPFLKAESVARDFFDRYPTHYVFAEKEQQSRR